jgi:ribosomal protein S18 acetylase RimI-like enzyme
MKPLIWRLPFLSQKGERGSTPPPKDALRTGRPLPRSAIRWLGPQGKIALRPFEWQTDADQICQWQLETYSINFPSFRFTPEFANAFRHDLRRATLDGQHGLFVLDDGPSGGDTCGFLWLVLCVNSWTGERYGYVNNIYVMPDKRGLHLAEELLKHGETWFRSRRVNRMRLTVTASNASALHLYERTGYKTERFEMEKEI